MPEIIEKIRVYNVALGALRGCSEEACVSCICTENVYVRLRKRMRKLRSDLSEPQFIKGKNEELSEKVNKMLGLVEGLPIKAESQECLMTRGICKSPKCIAHNISEMLNLVEP